MRQSLACLHILTKARGDRRGLDRAFGLGLRTARLGAGLAKRWGLAPAGQLSEPLSGPRPLGTKRALMFDPTV